MPPTESGCERWLWIELIGFDKERPDFGVPAYLDSAGFVHDAVSLFVFNPDFVHTHDGVEADRVFPFDYCSYGGHPASYERRRQDWTRHQLLGLVDELRRHGIAVYFAVFDIFVTDEWIGGHPEVLHVTRDGQRISSVCGWKRLADGSFYEDFFARQVGRVLRDYGFDGFHQADGYCHPRLTLWEGDYSEDMVEQFAAATGVALPDGLAAATGDRPEVIRARAAWIWRHARGEWISFYCDRIARFCRKVADAVHAEGKRVVLNNALTRDPFQAMYRYGVDYRRLAAAGVDGFIIEMVAPGVTLGAEGGLEAAPHYDFQAMLLLVKSAVPALPLRCLNGVHDVHEQWDVLRHGPQLLEREIYCQSNLYRRSGGNLERCSVGPVVCLADGLQPHEWRWLRRWWDLAYSAEPRRVFGATLLWSDRALDAQLEEFITTRRWTTHKLLYELLARGAPVYCAASVADLAAVDGPLLVLNPHLVPGDELAAVLAYDRGPLILIGGRPPSLSEPGAAFEDVHGPGQLFCGVYGAAPPVPSALPADEPEVPPEDVMGIVEPGPYFHELPFRRVSESFLAACAGVIADLCSPVRVLGRAEVVRVQVLELGERLWRLLVGNDSPSYVVTQLDVGREIESVAVLTDFPGTPPAPDGSRFWLKLPPKGMVVLDVALRA